MPSLTALLADPGHEVVAVLTRPPARSGRGHRRGHGDGHSRGHDGGHSMHASPVAECAQRAGVPVLTPARPSDTDFVSQLAELDVDCAAVVAYGALLREPALSLPRFGWVNLHFSLLPAWRGAAPVQHAVLHGDDLTGASTFLIGPGLDDGPVFGVITEPVRAGDTSGDLLARLAESGAQLLLATMNGIADGTLVAQPQPADGVSLAPKLSTADARVRLSDPALAVDRRIRACTPAPGAWLEFRGERLKLGPVRVSDDPPLDPGQLVLSPDAVMLGTATAPLRLGWVQPPGKKQLAAVDWARGARLSADDHFE